MIRRGRLQDERAFLAEDVPAGPRAAVLLDGDERPKLSLGVGGVVERDAKTVLGLFAGALRAAAQLGRRRYPQGVVRTLAVIEASQRAGLTLPEVRLMLESSPDDRAAIERLRDVAVRKLPELTALIERAELVRGWLEAAARCDCPTRDDCPLFEVDRLPAATGVRHF